jgi:hypothetical protein
MPGPLPSQNRRRRNAPTVPTTTLPAKGRTGRVPAVPAWTHLRKTGTAWWRWAWHTPQAAGWAPGMESLVARRASLEDDLAAAGDVESLELDELLGAKSAEVKEAIGRLAALATGRLVIFREMRELDDRLGLSPKGMATLRWTIADEDERPRAARKTSGGGVVVPGRWRDAAVG